MAPAPLFLPVADRWIEIRIEDPTLAEQMVSLWGHVVAAQLPAGVAAEPVIIHANVRGDDPSAAYIASGMVTRAVITALRGRYLLLHGAALARDGRAIAMVAPSGTGKSTAAVTLGSAPGVEYLTDECVVIDPRTWLVHPYPKPLSRVVSRDPFLKADVAPAGLGLVPARGPRPLAGVYLLARDGGEPQMEQVRLIETISALAPLTSSLEAMEAPLGTVASMLDRVGGARRVFYEESADLGEVLWAAGDRVAREPMWELLAPKDGGAGTEGGPAAGELLQLGEYHDALLADDGVAVLCKGQVMSLAGLPALIWLLLQEHGPLTRDELRDAVVAEIGEAPDAGDRLDAEVSRLSPMGLLAADGHVVYAGVEA